MEMIDCGHDVWLGLALVTIILVTPQVRQGQFRKRDSCGRRREPAGLLARYHIATFCSRSASGLAASSSR
jgi:hypothetical protein